MSKLDKARSPFDGVIQAIEELRNNRDALADERDRLREELKAIETWACKRCPCHNDEPSPCPLCGARVDRPDVCLSAENTFPPKLLGLIRVALNSRMTVL